MAFVPFTFLDDNITDAGDLISFEAFGALANNINHLIDAMPPGSIICVAVGIPGCPVPDATIWREMDGSQITDQNSPIRNSTVADYGADGGRYMRGYTNAGTIGNTGGSNEKDLSHNHGGATQLTGEPADNADSDKDRYSVRPHDHPISTDLTVVNYEPVHITFKHYMKVK